MCGRYSLFTSPDVLADRFDLAEVPDVDARYNCAPRQSLPVIRGDRPDELTTCEWGLVPEWVDDPEDANRPINARSETVTEKRTFRDAVERRRCLVPADGFYEWVEEGGGKQPYRVTVGDDDPFAMAGIWARWEGEVAQTGLGDFGGGDPDRSRVVESFTILTTEPNDVVEPLHHRMAVILPPDEESTWLHGDREAALDLLAPYPGDEMRAFPVSTAVNDPSNDSPAVVEPLDG